MVAGWRFKDYFYVNIYSIYLLPLSSFCQTNSEILEVLVSLAQEYGVQSNRAGSSCSRKLPLTLYSISAFIHLLFAYTPLTIRLALLLTPFLLLFPAFSSPAFHLSHPNHRLFILPGPQSQHYLRRSLFLGNDSPSPAGLPLSMLNTAAPTTTSTSDLMEQQQQNQQSSPLTFAPSAAAATAAFDGQSLSPLPPPDFNQ